MPNRKPLVTSILEVKVLEQNAFLPVHLNNALRTKLKFRISHLFECNGD